MRPAAAHRARLLANIAAYLALALLPIIAMLSGVVGPRLYGVVEKAPAPELSFDAVWAERFQHRAADWFQHGLGLRGYSIQIDSGILYHAFGETKHGSTVLIGEDDTLFIADDLNYFNKYGVAVTGSPYLDELAGKLAALQQAMARQGKALVPVIVPSKTSIYRDKVPAQWTAELGEPRPTDLETYNGLVLALAAHGVRYVDARKLLSTHPEPRHLLWGPQARHWSRYGACLVLSQVATAYAELTGEPRPPHDCTLKMERVTKRSTADLDLLALMNAKYTKPTYPEAAAAHYEPAPPGPRPRVVMNGTSFCWELASQAEESGRWGEVHLNYYNNAFYEVAGLRKEHKLEVGSPFWRTAILDKELYVLDLFEGYLMGGVYIDGFLKDATEALTADDPARPATRPPAPAPP
jgi:glyoxylase-like metal-dependent hydrolase (beta-lactamase superfamily II)